MMRGSLRFAMRCRSSILMARSRFMVHFFPRRVGNCRLRPFTLSYSGGGPSYVARPILPPQEIGAELVEARAADLAHHEIDLAAEDVDRLLDPGDATGGRTIERRPAHKAKAGAETKGDQDIGATPHAAVEHYGQPVADRLVNRRQH